MSTTRERAALACAKLEHDNNLRDAETQSQWAIRRSRFTRLRSTNERDVEQQHVKDSHTCFHDNPYTLACKQCGRDEQSARRERERIKLLISKL